MGITPQTISNGLKPYGLVYNLLDIQKTPVLWSINPTKFKDDIDFTVDGINFRGGTFVVEAQYASAPNVVTAINNFIAQGVVIHTTLTTVTIPIYKELKVFPRWVLDSDNGSIASAYLVNAGIPVTAYRSALPTGLNLCDDLFILPHADPTWATHGLPLLNWNAPIANGGNAGWLWAACHAVSVLENLGNTFPGATQRTNFLSVNGLWKYTGGSGNGFDNAVSGAINPQHNNTQTPPFNNPPLYPTDPVMQYMGISDGAHNAGSEKIYVPTNGWRSSTKVSVFDPDHPQMPTGLFPNQTALIAYGYAFGDSNRGKVMYEGGHDHDNGTVAENVAAQRAFLNFSFDAPSGKSPVITANTPPPSQLNQSQTVAMSVVSSDSQGGSVSYQWTSSCGGSFSAPTSGNTNFTAPPLNPGDANLNCVISVTVTDACSRKSFESYSVIIKAPPAPPVANDDSYSTYSSNVLLINPLLNDTDFNNNINPSSLSNTSPLAVAGGVFSINTDGTVTFTPTSGFSGTAILDYQICDSTPAIDGGPLCDTARITINVTASPCVSPQIVSSTTAYATAVTSSTTWTATTANALNAPDALGSLSNGNGVLVLDLGAGNQALVGSQIQFRIFTNNGSIQTGTIDASTNTTFPVAPITVTTTAAGVLASPNVFIYNVTQPGTRYVRITTNTNRFGVESITYQRLLCVTPSADLSILKTVNNPTPNIGSNVIFTLTANNAGPDSATGVTVNDLLPSGYTFVSATASTGTYTSGTGVWSVGTLANGSSATLNITATVNATGSYANTATIAANEADPTPGNNTSTSTPVPVPQANVSVAKTVNNPTPNVGSNVIFTLTASNAGPSSATGVSVTDALPAGYTFVSATASTGTYSSGTGIWSIGTLANGASATLNITATVNATGSYANTATIAANEADPTPGNNTSTSTPVPVPQANVSVAKTVNNPTPNVGSNVIFTLTASNAGPSSATGVSVTDALPSGYTFVSATASTGTYTSGTGVWSVGTLANGASATLNITATVNAL
ncbi:Ig-like domain-containing protein [Flavobacterium sp. XS2P24]|uniref:Ig-like domain-containing protein n=1 Tax=Flavobacterium sp. XS2P24 TaxID=3041249 RepID=UPI0024A7F993|nr:Ig-like domain-containing protein [Flavobacterium sp. XS2P24]MDI6050786.1 Ig-like domain-containing protein [Flavobacterium sp. XS2P24]